MTVQQLQWLTSALNERAQTLPKNFELVTEGPRSAIIAPSVIILAVGEELKVHGWNYTAGLMRVFGDSTFGSGTDISDHVIQQLQQSANDTNPLFAEYRNTAQQHLERVQKGKLLEVGGLSCQRLDGKMPLRVVRNAKNVYIELAF